MNFSTDRDLLAIEPTLFNDVVFPSQTRLEVSDGALSGTTLTSASANFVNAQIDAGDVVLVSGVPCEVIARVNATTLTLSRLRAYLSDDAIPPAAGTSLAVIHRTFEPQARAAHDELLHHLGIDPAGESEVTEDAIVSLSVMRDLELLAALIRIYEAGTLQQEEENRAIFRAKVIDYRQALRVAMRRGVIAFDLNGDGVADAVRDLSVIEMVRV